jgi:hypothetical protein
MLITRVSKVFEMKVISLTFDIHNMDVEGVDTIAIVKPLQTKS